MNCRCADCRKSSVTWWTNQEPEFLLEWEKFWTDSEETEGEQHEHGTSGGIRTN